MISSAAFIYLGSYPILITKSSKDLILLSFAKEDTFSIFNWDWMFAYETCNFDNDMVVLVKVEEII